MSFLEAFPQRFEAMLADCLPGDDCQPGLREAMSYSLLSGGKRLRPRLLAAAADLGDEGTRTPERAVLMAGAALEMIHCYSLIHDDLPAMDDDEWRRGQPSCHVAHGEAMAILAGDALQPLAFSTMAKAFHEASLPADTALCELAETAGPLQLVGGQAADISTVLPAELGDDELLRVEWVQSRKTAAMIRLPLFLGGLLAALSAEERDALSSAGLLLGLAFQTVDDLLDRSATLAELGKTPGKDEAQGKLTLAAAIGEEAARTRVDDLFERALAYLPTGPRGRALRELAEQLVNRRS